MYVGPKCCIAEKAIFDYKGIYSRLEENSNFPGAWRWVFLSKDNNITELIYLVVSF